MKVHFACSTTELATYKSNYRKICAAIKNLGHTITRDWLEDAIKIVEGRKLKSLDRKAIYRKVTAAIFSADVLIIEGTVASFSVGHQITLSLSKNKPTLVLISKKQNKGEIIDTKHSFLGGIDSPFLKVVEYDNSNVAGIIKDFLHNVGKSPLVKFNIVLTKEIEKYLDWVSFTYKINKSEYIRNLILKNMDEENKLYQKYLKMK